MCKDDFTYEGAGEKVCTCNRYVEIKLPVDTTPTFTLLHSHLAPSIHNHFAPWSFCSMLSQFAPGQIR